MKFGALKIVNLERRKFLTRNFLTAHTFNVKYLVVFSMIVIAGEVVTTALRFSLFFYACVDRYILAKYFSDII